MILFNLTYGMVSKKRYRPLSVPLNTLNKEFNPLYNTNIFMLILMPLLSFFND